MESLALNKSRPLVLVIQKGELRKEGKNASVGDGLKVHDVHYFPRLVLMYINHPFTDLRSILVNLLAPTLFCFPYFLICQQKIERWYS